MLENEKKGFFEKTSTRRVFLQTSGRGITGLAVSYSVLSLFGCSEVPEDVTGYAIPTGLLIADRSRCTGCQRCEMMCTGINDGATGAYTARVKVSRTFNLGEKGPNDNYRRENGHMGTFVMNPETCKQCKDPECANACPVKAIKAADVTGTRVVDESICIGCGACTAACPWHMPTVSPATGKSTKCILCGVCAEHCITSAIRVVPWEDVRAVLKKHGKSFV